MAYRDAERTRLARALPPKDITLTQDETFTGGLCLVGIESVSNSIVLEQLAQARDHDTWQALMEPALAGLNCQVIQSTSDEAPGRLAYVAHHLGAHHSPEGFHVQHALSKAVSAPLAATQRAAAQAATQAEETRTRVHEHADNTHGEPPQRGPGRPPQATPGLEQAAQEVAAAPHAHPRLAGQRTQVTQRMRASGQAYHLVDVEHGVRRNGKRIAGDIPQHIDTIRAIAHQEGRSETYLDRIEKAARVVPTMQATIAFVSGSVRPQVSQRALTQPESYAMPAHPTLCTRWSVRGVEPSGARPAQGQSANARGGMPTFELPCGRAQRVPLIEEPSTARARPPQKAGLPDRDAHLLSHADRRDDCCGAVLRPEASVDVCGDLASVEIPPAPLRPLQRAMG